jgi:beta-glucosidase
MGEWQEQMMGFDVEDVLSQLSQNEKIALLSGKLPCLVRG